MPLPADADKPGGGVPSTAPATSSLPAVLPAAIPASPGTSQPTGVTGSPTSPTSPFLLDALLAEPAAADESGAEFVLLCQSPLRTSELSSLLDVFEPANAAASETAVPLTRHVATTLPKPSEVERRITRAYKRAIEDTTSLPDQPEDELADVDGEYDGEADDDDSAPAEADRATPRDDADDPDPFYDPDFETGDGGDISHLDPVLATIYILVNWLHEQWHLPRAPCQVLLHVFALLFFFLGYPDLQRRTFVTLKSVRRALGTDVNVQLLPVCPVCRDVFPSVDPPASCPSCDEPLFRTSSRNGKRIVSNVPVVKYPYCAISAQLSAILNQPGVEDACDSWRTRERVPGEYRDVFDGHVVRNLKAHDGTLFWRNDADCARGPNGELRLGVMWGLDWFSHIVSNTAPSHSSCPTSFSIANLPDAQRFRTANLICTSILPGPKEQSGDEVQRFIRPIVSDLLRLWKDGVVIKTPSCPLGRRVRVILLALVCDKPAAHKVAGFASHRHKFFCHNCWCNSDDMATPAAFERDKFAARTDEQQREYGDRYRDLRTKSEREAFVREYATRYSQLSRLPYFDLVKQVVIDPMHNLALGLVKAQFYHIWVQTGILSESKLRSLHELISLCLVPDYLGRLPKEIGVPAGGSLTADQWIILATTMGPLTIPQLWENTLDSSTDIPDRRVAVAEFEQQKRIAAQARAREREVAKEQRKLEKAAAQNSTSRRAALATETGSPAVDTASGTKRKRAAPQKAGKPVPEIPYTMHRDDPGHFQLLATALHILLHHVLTDTGIDEAEQLLRQYCGTIIPLYGTSCIRPNHHYAIHVAEYARAFGPLCGFWTFLFERLNRVLKSYNTNNHGNGDIETTFFTEFLRTCSTSRLVYQLLRTPEGSITNLSAQQMSKSTHEERGTLAGLSQLATDLERSPHSEGPAFMLSRAYGRHEMSDQLYCAVLTELRRTRPDLRVYHALYNAPNPRSVPLTSAATFYEHVNLRGRRYHASSYHGNINKALVSAMAPGFSSLAARVCEILEILTFQQAGSSDVFLWAHVRWLKPLALDPVPDWWKSTASFDRRLWQQDSYDVAPGAPSTLIDVSSIRNHVARVPVVVGGQAAWATIGLDKDA